MQLDGRRGAARWHLVAAILCSMAWCTPGTAMSEDSLELIGSWGGQVEAVAVQGTLAFLAEGSELQIVDCADPAKIEPVSRARMDGPIKAIAVGWGRVVVATGDRLTIFDVSDPRTPLELASIDPRLYVRDIELRGHHLYVTGDSGSGGFAIWDVGDVERPVLLDRIGYPNHRIGAMSIVGEHAFLVARYGSGTDNAHVIVVDVSDPESLLQVATYAPSDFVPRAICSEGEQVLVSGVTGAGPLVHVLDSTVPHEPRLVSQFPLQGLVPAFPGVFVAADANLYVGTYESLDVYKVSDSASPIVAASVHTEGLPLDMVIHAGRAYLADGTTGLQVFGTNGIAPPVEVGSIDLMDSPWGVVIYEDIALVPMRSSGLLLVDVSDPHSTKEIMRIPALDAVWNVEVSGEVIAIEDAVTRLFDLSDPRNPVERGTVEGQLLELAGAHLYTKQSDETLEVHDVSDPSAPVLVTTHLEDRYKFVDLEIRSDLIYACIEERGRYSGLFRIYRRDHDWSLIPLGEVVTERTENRTLINGGTAYLVGQRQLTIVDVTAPGSPVVRGICPTASGGSPSSAGELALIGSWLLVAMTNGDLQVFDVSTPDWPTLAWRMELPQSTYGVAERGAIAVAASGRYYGGGRLSFLDFFNAVEPQLVGHYPVPDRPYSVDVSEGIAYVGGQNEDLILLDVRSPDAIQPWGTLEYERRVVAVDVEDSVACAVLWYDGIAIIDASDPAMPVEVARISAPRGSVDAAVEDGTLYVAGRHTYDGSSHQNGLSIFDLADPAHPDSLGVLNLGGSAIVVEVRDNVSYVGVDKIRGDDALHVVEVSDPSNPVELSSLMVGEYLHDVAILGNYAAVSTGAYDRDEMLHIIDVTDPNSPVRVAGLEMPDAGALHAEGTTVYVATGLSGVAVVDLSDPRNPVRVTNLAVSGQAIDVGSEAGIQYIASITGGLFVFRAEGAVEPQEIAHYSADRVIDVAMVGTLAVAVDEGRGLRVIDVADPTDPVELGFVRAAEVPPGSRVEVFGRHAYWAVEAGFRVVDIGDPAVPVPVGEFRPDWPAERATVRGHVVTPASVFLAAEDGLRVVDVRDPGQPHEIGFLDARRDCKAIDLHGNTAFVLLSDMIWVVDVSDPSEPVGIEFIEIDRVYGGVVDIQVEDRAIYVGTRDGVVLIYRRTSADTAELASTLPTRSPTWQMQLVGPVLYLAARMDGLVMVDVSDLDNPRLVGQMDTDGACDAVDAVGGLACLADQFSGVRLVDVRDVGAPRLLGSYELPTHAGAVAVADGRAYVVDVTKDDQGIHVVDTTDPTRLRESEARRDASGVHGIDIEGSTLCWLASNELRVADVSGDWDAESATARTVISASDVEIAGDIAYVSVEGHHASSGGLALFDVSDPSALEWLNYQSLPEYAMNLEVADNLVFVATRSSTPTGSPGRVYVVDASDPLDPHVLASVEFSRDPADLFARDDLLFVGVGDSLAVLDVTHPGSPILLDETLLDGPVRALDGDGTMLFVAVGNRVRAYAWNQTSGFEERGSVQSDRPLDLEVADGLIYVAGDRDGLAVLRYFPTVGVFPGDTDNSGFVDELDVLPLGVYFGATGPARAAGSRSWSEQTVRQWDPAAATYADTDGDGEVTERDLLAIGMNWGEEAATSGPAWVIDRTDPRLRAEASASLTHLYLSLPASGESSRAIATLLEQILGLELIPRRYDLLQNEPNPFNPMTTIRFDLPAASDVRLRIYDLRGRLVETLLDDVWYPPGRHAFDFRPKSLASGVYIYRIETDLGVRNRKMSVLK